MTSQSNGQTELEQLRETVEVQNRTIRALLQNYNDLLDKFEAEATPAAAPLAQGAKPKNGHTGA